MCVDGSNGSKSRPHYVVGIDEYEYFLAFISQNLISTCDKIQWQLVYESFQIMANDNSRVIGVVISGPPYTKMKGVPEKRGHY